MKIPRGEANNKRHQRKRETTEKMPPKEAPKIKRKYIKLKTLKRERETSQTREETNHY